jgi:hypothetical protein
MELPPLDSLELGRSEERIVSITNAAIQELEARLKRRAKRLRERLRLARDAHDRAQRGLHHVSATEGDRPFQGWHPWLRIAVLVVLGVVEAAFNVAVFHLLGDSVLATWALAVVTSVVVVFGAHFTGIAIRQWEHQPISLKVLTGLFDLVFVPFIVSVNLVRLKAAEQHAGGLLEPRIAMFVFLGANIGLFLVATIISYLSHDAHPDYENAHRGDLRSAKRIGRYESRLGYLRERLRVASRDLAELGTEKMHYYQTINSRVRRDGVPRRFSESLNVYFYEPDMNFFGESTPMEQKKEVSNVAAIPEDARSRVVPRRGGFPSND